MKDDTQQTGRRGNYFRYAVFALAALLVVSLGFVLIPREPVPPAAPPFSEQARASAFSDAVALRAAGLELEDAAGAAQPETQAAALNRAVTLLTVHARALLLPANRAGGTESGTTQPGTTQPADGSTETTGPTASVSPPSTAGELAAALQTSGAQRLKDAETADGGMARLLAGAGIAQLLAAEDLAAASGLRLAALPDAALPNTALPGTALPSTGLPGAALPSTALPGTGGDAAGSASGSCVPPTGPAAADTGSADTGSAGTASADMGSALAAAVKAELELVYAYQAALPRLNPAAAAPASDFLLRHGDLRDQAENLSRSQCAVVPLGAPGYALSQDFLSAPAVGLGTLEAGALPIYGDVVALSSGSERAWGLLALQSAARRTAHWGASPGPVPGMVLDESVLPQLPDASLASPAATSAASPGTP